MSSKAPVQGPNHLLQLFLEQVRIHIPQRSYGDPPLIGIEQDRLDPAGLRKEVREAVHPRRLILRWCGCGHAVWHTMGRKPPHERGKKRRSAVLRAFGLSLKSTYA